MEIFSGSLRPLSKKLKRLRRYWIEGTLLLLAIIITFISGFLYLNSEKSSEKSPAPMVIREKKDQEKPVKIYVDISGSVKKPGLYEALNGERLESVIKKAGGLAEDADRDFFARNFNLARLVTDQEKIHIPSVWEVSKGYFIEGQYVTASSGSQDGLAGNTDRINLNLATLEELDTLPGIGKITAQKIIDGRPFRALQDLIDKKVVGQSVFENIKELIEI